MPTSFAEVMQRALYDPEHGYYGRGPRRIGRSGDFFTAVSVGPLYGQLIAQVTSDVFQSLGCPADFTLFEQGAHDGQLAEDIWNGWPHPTRPRYAIIEPQPAYRAAQQQRLQPLMQDRITWFDDFHHLASFPRPSSDPESSIKHLAPSLPPTFFLSNELLDAFPVHRVRWNGEQWRELYVSADHQWIEGDLSTDDVRAEAARLPTDLPSGYTTEVHPAAAHWMRQLACLPFVGTVLIADYGYEAPEYYQPERSEGTLRRYHQHRSDGDVLDQLGECDLTAHINFTRVIEEAEAAGLKVERFMDQGRFLTHAATRWLQSLEGSATTPSTAAALRQFHTLTHPAHMGAAFKMLLLRKPAAHPPS